MKSKSQLKDTHCGYSETLNFGPAKFGREKPRTRKASEFVKISNTRIKKIPNFSSIHSF